MSAVCTAEVPVPTMDGGHLPLDSIHAALVLVHQVLNQHLTVHEVETCGSRHLALLSS